MSLAEEVHRELAALRPARERARQAVAELTDDRRIEWLATAVIAGLGVSLALPGETLASSPAYRELHAVLGNHGEAFVALTLLAIAAARATALIVNGVRGRPTSAVRFASAAIGAGIFSAFSYYLALPWLLGSMSAPSTGVLTYAALAGADYVNAIRAASDARIYRGG